MVDTVQRCWFHEEDRERTALHHNWRRIWDYADSMSRIHSISKSWHIPTEMVDLFKHQDRPSLGCDTLSSRRTLLHWYHDRIVVWRLDGFVVRIVNGVNKYVTETSEEIPSVRILIRPSAQENLWQRLNQSQDLLWIQMSMFLFLKENGCFEVSKFMTRTLRHDSLIPREDGAVRFDYLIEGLKDFLSVPCDGQSKLGWILWQKEEEGRKGFNTAWILIHPMNSCTCEQPKDTQEKISLIHHCFQMTSPSTTTTSGTPTRCIPLFKVEWSREDEARGRTQNGRCPKIIENSKIGMSRHLVSSTTTQMAKIMVQNGRSSRSSWEICTVILWQDCYGKGSVRMFFWKRGGKKFQIGNAYSSTDRKDYSCLCTWTISKWQERNKKHRPDLENSHERRWFDRTNNIPLPCLFGLHSTRIRNKKRCCGQ